jgi:type VI secretion system secreted protein VgrG
MAEASHIDLRVLGVPSGAISVVTVRGREALNELFTFRVEVVASAEVLGHEPDIVGAPALLVFAAPDGGAARRIEGIIDAVKTLAIRDARGRGMLRLRLVPALARLKRRRSMRIFQDLSVPEILGKLLDEASIQHKMELALGHTKRAYCVQYRESDYAFFKRLCAEEGIAFTFLDSASDVLAPKADGQVLLFDEAAHYVAPADGPLPLEIRPDDGLQEGAGQVLSFGAVARLRSKTYLLGDYDFRRPLFAMSASHEADEGEAEIYDHRGDYDEPDVRPEKARVALEQERQRARTGEGRSLSRQLFPGLSVFLAGQIASDIGGDLAVIEVEHEGRVPENGAAMPSGARIYENRFRCVPRGHMMRPRLPERQPRQVLETATVVGPADQEVHTDEHARVKVQFHWDRDGKRDEHSSAWLRVSQAWAGAAYGAQFIPRIGMEVLVSFLGGDTDCPLVLGCLYNAAHPSPFPLPGEKLKSGFRTKSSPGEGANEVSFDDRAGSEKILISAQRDLEETAGKDHTVTITGNQLITVAGSRQDSVAGGQTSQIAGSVLVQIAGAREEQIALGQRQIIGQSRSIVVHGTETDTVKGSSLKTVEGEASLRVNGNLGVQVGTEDKPGTADVFAWGDYALGSYANINLRAHDGISLTCGDSRIDISQKSITVSSPTLVFRGSERVTVKGQGPSIDLGKEAEIVADKVRIYAEKASLELDTDAHLDGTMVKLNCGAGDPSELTDENGEPKLQHLSLKLTDSGFEPYANKDFVVRAAGSKILGTTDAGGMVEVDLPKEATSAEITLWLEPRPTGKTKRYVVKLGELPDAATARGAQIRLRNLGYYWGKEGDELDAGTKKALRDFQEDHDLKAEGDLDAATQAKLKEVHGH